MTQHAHLHSEGSANLDALSAFDRSDIGREFVAETRTLSQQREHETRRAQLMVEGWKSTITDSQRIPKANLKRSCNYDVQKANSQSIMTISVYVVSACAAGVVIAWVLKNLGL